MQMAFYCRKKFKTPSPSNTMTPSSLNPDDEQQTQNPNMSTIDEDQDQNVQQHSAFPSETLTLETPNPQFSDHQQQQDEVDPEELEQEEPEQTGMVCSPCPPHNNPIGDAHVAITIPDQDPVSDNPHHEPITDTHVTITIPDQDPVPENLPLTTPTTPSVSRRGGGTKRKKPMAAKKRQALTKKLELLSKTFKPIPFVPSKSLDFSTHEKLLKRLGLWDFVHVELDRNIRTDLVAQLIATFNPQARCSYINDIRISVSRADLTRALKLPGKKDKSSVEEVEVVSEESIAFVEGFVSNWVILHEDMWILPNEVLNWIRVIKEGHPEKVDWASLMWFMVEKEVAQGSRLGHCYYASHLQCLIKSQREGVFVRDRDPIIDVTLKEDEDDVGEVKVSEDGGDVKMSDDCGHVKMGEDCNDVKMAEDGDDMKMVVEGIDVKMVEKGNDMKMGDEGADVKMGEVGIDVKMGVGMDGSDVKMRHDVSYEGHELEEPNIELCLGQDSLEREQLVQDDVMDFEECKEQEPGKWLLNGKNNMGEHFLQRCNQDIDLVCDEGEKQEQADQVHEQEEQQDQVHEQEEQEDQVHEQQEQEHQLHEQEDQVHLQEQQEIGFTLLPKCNSIGAISSANLIQEIEASQVPYNSPMQLQDHSLMEQFTSRGEANLVSGGPSIFADVSRREIDHEHEISQHPLNGNHKRLRSNEPWEQKSPDFDLCMENLQLWMGKAKMFYQAKEQTCIDLNANQEMLMNEIQQRDNLIAHLNKLRFEEQQKGQVDIYRRERELFVMGDLLKGYRKALNETRRAFSEYRAGCPLPEEPLYKDVPGSGGLVLSATELERRRLKQEEEEKIKRIEIEDRVKEFEADWTDKFEVHLKKAGMLNSKLLNADEEVKLLKEIFSERKGFLAADSSPNE